MHSLPTLKLKDIPIKSLIYENKVFNEKGLMERNASLSVKRSIFKVLRSAFRQVSAEKFRSINAFGLVCEIHLLISKSKVSRDVSPDFDIAMQTGI